MNFRLALKHWKSKGDRDQRGFLLRGELTRVSGYGYSV